jgi:hypothetical protein
MSSVEQAYETQLKNIQTRTGKTLEELGQIVRESGLTKHGEIREMLKHELGMGHGDANTLVHYLFQSDGERAAKAAGATTDEVLSEIYAGAKADLRPIHDRLMDHINLFGEFEIAPKKGYVSLRRKKQFAMIGPATKTQVELGLNVKALPADERMKEMPKGSMCNYTIRLADAAEVDEELITWIRQAYDSAG